MAIALQQHEYWQGGEAAEREGLVVWDQKGLVILWPDGHCSRFPWAVLRQSCLCAECRGKREDQQAAHQGSPPSQDAYFTSRS
jgi:DUF971 family protein